MLGGWPEFKLMHNGLSLGLLYGSYSPVGRFLILNLEN